MKLYVSDIKELYKYTIIGHLVNSGPEYLLLHIVHCCIACVVNEESNALHMVLYCLHMMYKRYSPLEFYQSTRIRNGNIYNEIFNNIPYFVKTSAY